MLPRISSRAPANYLSFLEILESLANMEFIPPDVLDSITNTLTGFLKVEEVQQNEVFLKCKSLVVYVVTYVISVVTFYVFYKIIGRMDFKSSIMIKAKKFF